MHLQIHLKRPNKRPRNTLALVSSIALIALVLVSGSEAIVKQQQQQRSDDSQSQPGNGQQSHHSAYNNHQSPSLGSSVSSSVSMSQSSQPSYASSSSISSPSSSVASQSSAPAQVSAQGSIQQSSRSDQLGYTNYAASSAVNNQPQNAKSSSNYLDSNSAVPQADQSYQAAASSVNMALANSGIFSPSGSNYVSSGSPSNIQGSSSSQSLNPLHYFYYPSKESSSNSQAKSSQAAMDVLSNSASNNYQSLVYPSYADQLNSALSNIGSGPEAAASNQDPSYLPQSGNSNYGLNDGSNNGQQSSLYNGYLMGVDKQQQVNSSVGADMGSYSNNINPAQQGGSSSQQHNSPSSISFNGPTSDYMNSHVGGSGHQQLGSYSNLYNQMGDLSTSNFGNNAGGLSSVASYMAPSQQSTGNQQDIYSGLLANSNQQFNSAASQLSPAAVSPPVMGNNQQGGASNGLGPSSLFTGGNSLFGQQAGSPSANSANNPFANQQYLSSFLSPQQYSQLAGQQPQLNDQQQAASSTSSAVSGGNSKRFGIGSFIMPMLALAGLSLLIPTMSNIGTAVGRKKRSISDRASSSNRQQQIAFESMNGDSQLAKESSIGEYMDKIERYYSIYKNAVESEECLNRLICEFGDAVKDITGKSAVVMVIEKLVPTWMTGKVHLFKEAALDHKEGKEKCRKYICKSSKHQD